MARAKRYPRIAVPGSTATRSNLLARVKPTGNHPKQVNAFPGIRTPNPVPPGNPTGRGTSTG